MAKKAPKRQFDWKTYSRPARLLSEAQEVALAEGLLAPLLRLALADDALRLEIRARSANLYCRGTLVVRVTGESPFVAEMESDVGGAPDRLELATEADAARLLAAIAEKRTELDASYDPGGRPERAYLQLIADSNAGIDLFASEYVVLDMEHTYGKRRYDLVLLRRVEGVTGPGGFAHARLVFADVRTPGQALSGASGLDVVAGDLAEMSKALGGSHLERIRAEFAALAAQKVRLGLLPPELEVRELDAALPEALVVFAGTDASDTANDAAIVALHERLASRHYPTERLRFVAFPDVPETPGPALAIAEENVLDYRGFKEYRARRREE